jgi:Flp pilus assembly protein TadG
MKMKALWRRLFSQKRSNEGQSLLETAVAMPLLLGIAFNIINLGYFWFTILTMSAAPRVGVQYSAQGGMSASTMVAPSAGSVSALVYDNMTRAINGSTSSNTAVRVCSGAVGVSSGGTSLCTSFGPSFGFDSNTTDPEAPVFVLNRVDVGYTVTPLIPGTAFNVVLPANLNFKRHVSMRSLF